MHYLEQMERMNKYQGLVAQYLFSRESVWRPTTLKSETAKLNSLVKYGLIGQDPTSVLVFLKEQGYKPYYIKQLFVRLGDFYYHTGLQHEAASLEQWLKTNEHLFRNAYQRQHEYVSKETMDTILYTVAKNFPHAYNFWKLGTMCGLRRTEIKNFNPKTDIDFKEGVVVVPDGKGGKYRRVLFKDSGPVPLADTIHNKPFFRMKDVDSSFRTINHIFADELRAPLTPHSLRAYAITQWLEKLPSHLAAAQAGHKSLLTTEKYSSVDEKQIKQLL